MNQSVNIVAKDFCVFNKWRVDHQSERFYDGQPRHLIDESTGRRYLNEDKLVVGFKCFLLTIGTLPVHLIASSIKVLQCAFNAVFAFIQPAPHTGYNLKNRISDSLLNIAKIVIAPTVIALLEVSAVYGIFSPYNGRKLYASLERSYYGSFILAPCFQPQAQKHLFGGRIEAHNAF